MSVGKKISQKKVLLHPTTQAIIAKVFFVFSPTNYFITDLSVKGFFFRWLYQKQLFYGLIKFKYINFHRINPLAFNNFSYLIAIALNFIGNVQQQLESLQRCQSLEEVQRLYEHGDYAAVVDLLILTFNQPRTSRKVS